MSPIIRAGLDLFHPAVQAWFSRAFTAPTRAQREGWPVIARGDSTLILAPTGNGKTLAAFLWCLDRVLFSAPPAAGRCRVVYVSPLKALAADVERNLRAPLEGISAAARELGVPVTVPEIAIRTGDTPARDRARFASHAADILITTPESLFLLLTSNARTQLAGVETVIIDEIHALVPGKRGAHLALSLERLEAIVEGVTGRPLQRIGLSATQRPIDEAAHFLGGALLRRERPAAGAAANRRRAARDGTSDWHTAAEAIEDLHDEFAASRVRPSFRPVTIVDATEPKRLDLRVDVPIDEAARQPRAPARRRRRRGAAAERTPEDGSRSIWSSIHPRLLALVRAHRSTLLFVNNRRLAERLADALNTLAGEALVRSHHGSLAPATRAEVEDLLKAGHIRALVTTSSLELGIDMGAIDLVVQIETPPSVASGLQRIGRAGHQAGASSAGVIVPKFRGDLLASAACTRAMRDAAVEATRYPRNPLDVLAQQIVGMTAMDVWRVDALFARVRCAAPFATLSRGAFEGVLDMLAGRYPSDAFAELRPRITWDRVRGLVTARDGARRVVVANAGTIPDRGLYGVFLAGANRTVRVGELDEEMVFETRVGDTFTLGASSWRVEEITHDRVLVTPAPGEPGRMPFWHGDQAGRSVALGSAIGALARTLRTMPRAAAITLLTTRHDLDRSAAEVLLRYLDDQAAAGAVPDDRTIVIERCLDDLGDWRVCLLSPFGSRVHAPWAMASAAWIRQRMGFEVEIMWGDDGFVVRFPSVDQPPDPSLLLPEAGATERLVLGQIGGTSLFAARFREAAARALLLPRRRPGARTPLWHQRKRAADLLAVASQFGSFPILLETHREILRDHFDLPALTELLDRVAAGTVQTVTIDTRTPSPFAASLLFSYVATYIYDGDAPLAERRAQALSVDQAQLRDLLGDAELRELLDPDALEGLERELQHLDARFHARTPDAVHDLLLRVGDLSAEEVAARSALQSPAAVLASLVESGRIVELTIAGEPRYAAMEDAARYRDALALALPPGLPAALLEPVRDPAGDLVLRYARTHGPFTVRDLATRFGITRARAEEWLSHTVPAGRLVEGEFRPHGTGREWVDSGVLRTLRRRSLARLRRAVEPVEADALGRFLPAWHGIGANRQGLEALLDAIEQLQGAPLPASILERDILPARVADYQPSMLDTLAAAGEVAWIGIEPLGARDGRIALYLTDHLHRLRTPIEEAAPKADSRAADVLAYLRAHGASFFAAIHAGTGGGYPRETVGALWELVWMGLVSNDTLHALRAYLEPEGSSAETDGAPAAFRSRRLVPASAQGRWSLTRAHEADEGRRALTPLEASRTTAWAAAQSQQLLTRYGIVAREAVASEGSPGGFAALYPVFAAMEEAGRVRRGYFVSGLGGAQFAMPAALEQLRAGRARSDDLQVVVLAASDPANPYGAMLKWPDRLDAGAPPGRVAGALVILVDGFAAAYLRRSERELLLFGPDEEPQRTNAARAAARALARLVTSREESRRAMLLEDINGQPAIQHPAAHIFAEEGFAITGMGLQIRRKEEGGRRME